MIGVIFDMDGVLVLTEQAHWQSWLVPARARGVELSHDAFKRCFGRVNNDCVPALFGSTVTPAEINAISEEKESAFREIVRHHVPLAPGVIKLLSTLKELGARLAVASSGPRENIETILSGGGIAQFFDATVNGGDVKRGKPAPDPFLLAAKRIRVSASACAVVEDAPSGIQAAVAAGMLAIGVTTTHAEPELRRAGAAQIYPGPADIDAEKLAAVLRWQSRERTS